jgi:hypothetical protein
LIHSPHFAATRVRDVGRIESPLDELGLALHAALVVPGNFQPVTVHGGLAYVDAIMAVD